MVSPRDIRIARPFAELLTKTNYSFLEGASHPEEILLQAKELGYGALGVCDRNGVYGAPRCHVAAKEVKVKLLVGSEVFVSGKPVYLIAKNRSGYGDLCQLLTRIHTRGEDPVDLTLDDIFESSRDLYCVLPALGADPDWVGRAKDAFGDRLSLAAHRHFDGTDSACLRDADRLSRRFAVEVIATTLPLFHVRERKNTQDVLKIGRASCRERV